MPVLEALNYQYRCRYGRHSQFKNDRKWAWLLNFARAPRARVYCNPPFINPGSATATPRYTVTMAESNRTVAVIFH